MTAAWKALLSIEQVVVSYRDSFEIKPLVRDVSFQLYPGEIVALTGPSGCGKSLTAHAIVGLLAAGVQVTQGQIYYKGENVVHNDEKRWQKLRREEIALLIQQSLNGLNPIRTVKKQMVETLKQTSICKKKEMEPYLCSLLSKVGFTDPKHILSSYPFELSGGMSQRVLLAMMLSLRPKLLIADEPTTALDALNRDKVLQLFKQLKNDFDLTILLITHDQQSVDRIADRVIQMSPEGMLL